MEFLAQIDTLPLMLGFITDQAIAMGIKGEKLGKIELALEEALVNVIHYAFSEADSNNNKLQIQCNKIEPSQFAVTIKDGGKPFNPCEQQVNLQTDVPLEERAVGGLGIYLMRQLVDEMHYNRLNHENILRLVFKI